MSSAPQQNNNKEEKQQEALHINQQPQSLQNHNARVFKADEIPIVLTVKNLSREKLLEIKPSIKSASFV